ncbi:FHA domain-containing protein [candidate division CSSED10-310 bacterium]|uniref:FHA domain-containing protein n=1 Tax=candidate division CSSED10-310 bacterium TaxID=2855610 RepID=A0ABV6Z4S4_UNCC1
MQLTLKVIKEGETGKETLHEFTENNITIGRERTNLLYLSDARKTVGRKHAKIELHGKRVHLIDLESRNHTFLNGTELKPNQPYILHFGDTFKIGHFIIEVISLSTVQEQESTGKDTKPDLEIINPFSNDVSELVIVLSKINKHYGREKPKKRRKLLQEALKQAFQDMNKGDANSVIANYLGPRTIEPVVSAPPPTAEMRPSPIDERMSSVVDVVLEAIVQFIKAFAFFRMEFLGQTVNHSVSVEELKKSLLASEISAEDFHYRLDKFKDSAQQAVVHQVALLDGYKVSVNEGTRLILNELDPGTLKEELSKERFKLGRLIPFSFRRRFMKFFQEKHLRLLSEDQGIVEKKMFREGFIHGYSERLFSSREKNVL